jgi:hypothetical protein
MKKRGNKNNTKAHGAGYKELNNNVCEEYFSSF